MASAVASNVINRVFGWVKQKNIRLIFDASLLMKIKEKEQSLAGLKPHIISLKWSNNNKSTYILSGVNPLLVVRERT
jgi:hypothetical protein